MNGSDVVISFVVPAYNEELRLGRTVAAIIGEIRRTGVASEIIVVNNASTDNTRDIALSFPEVTLVDEPIKGLVQARRAGFLNASGALIANIDADTIVSEFWLDRVLKAFAEEPGLVAISGPYIYYDVPAFTRMAVWGFYVVAYFFYLLSRFVLRVGSMLQGGNFVVRRAALEKIGYNPAFSFYGEDTDLARRLHAVGGVRFTFRLATKSSGRRLLGEGLMKIGWRYSINFLWATFRRKPFTDEWIDIRT